MEILLCSVTYPKCLEQYLPYKAISKYTSHKNEICMRKRIKYNYFVENKTNIGMRCIEKNTTHQKKVDKELVSLIYNEFNKSSLPERDKLNKKELQMLSKH